MFSPLLPPAANLLSKHSCRAARGSTTDESQMVPCLRHSAICRRYVYVPLRSALNAWSTLRSGRCWTRATGTQQHWHAAPRAHTILSANVRASGQASLPVCASACRAFVVKIPKTIVKLIFSGKINTGKCQTENGYTALSRHIGEKNLSVTIL